MAWEWGEDSALKAVFRTPLRLSGHSRRPVIHSYTAPLVSSSLHILLRLAAIAIFIGAWQCHHCHHGCAGSVRQEYCVRPFAGEALQVLLFLYLQHIQFRNRRKRSRGMRSIAGNALLAMTARSARCINPFRNPATDIGSLPYVT